MSNLTNTTFRGLSLAAVGAGSAPSLSQESIATYQKKISFKIMILKNMQINGLASFELFF